MERVKYFPVQGIDTIRMDSLALKLILVPRTRRKDFRTYVSGAIGSEG